jgi:CDGSH-type Zn-finger protein
MTAYICGIDIPPCHERGIPDQYCYSKCEQRKANQMNANSTAKTYFCSTCSRIPCRCQKKDSAYNAGDATVNISIDPESIKRATEHMKAAMERVKLLGRIEELRVECAATSDTAKQWQDMYNQAMEHVAQRNEETEQLRAVMATSERMRAATCRCGHVGAECFNDSYCDVPKVGKVTFDGDGTSVDYHYAQIDNTLLVDEFRNQADHWRGKFEIALAEIQAMKEAHKVAQYKQYEQTESWRNAYMKRGDTATQVEVDLQNHITELESALKHTTRVNDIVVCEMDRLGQIINDLQADYAQDMQAWRNMHDAYADVLNEENTEQFDEIERLKGAIGVLCAMVKPWITQ